jgi:hypothetical protein
MARLTDFHRQQQPPRLESELPLSPPLCTTSIQSPLVSPFADEHLPEIPFSLLSCFLISAEPITILNSADFGWPWGLFPPAMTPYLVAIAPGPAATCVSRPLGLSPPHAPTAAARGPTAAAQARVEVKRAKRLREKSWQVVAEPRPQLVEPLFLALTPLNCSREQDLGGSIAGAVVKTLVWQGFT